jgi:hypothetical protein
LLQAALEQDGLRASLRLENDKLYIEYPAHEGGYGYVSPVVLLDFGARSTGEPTEIHDVTCDAAAYFDGATFPVARPRVMKLQRTFWEKATAAHVYCMGGGLAGERFARHWSDLDALSRNDRYESTIHDRAIALDVARYKKHFYRAKAADGSVINYEAAIGGELRLVPDGDALVALADDYAKTLEAGLLPDTALSFDDLMKSCQSIEDRLNRHSDAP